MDLISRHRNLTILVMVLFAQVVGLAVQVKRTTNHGSTSLIRLWSVRLITPAEKAMVHSQDWARHVWRNYFYLRGVRRENERLELENLRLRLEQVRMAEDAGQAQRLQALLRFKEQFISTTVAAQVIGSSGSETSRLVYIDKGARDGIQTDMAVIVPEGIVGKVIRVFPTTSQVLEINDQSSGLGAMLEKSRLQGILKGTSSGETMLHYITSDERVEVGEMVVSSGGDRIFPKGMPIGRVVQVSPDPEAFLNIRVKPAAPLHRLEEVLVITKVDEKEPQLVPGAPMRAADILAQRLPTVPVKSPDTIPGTAPLSVSGARPASAIAMVGARGPTAVKEAAGPATGALPNAAPGAKPPNATGKAGANTAMAARISAKPKAATSQPSDVKPAPGTAAPSVNAASPKTVPVEEPKAPPGNSVSTNHGADTTPVSGEPNVAPKPKQPPPNPAKPVAETQNSPTKENPQ